MRLKRRLIAGLAPIAVLALAGCAGTGSSGSGPSPAGEAGSGEAAQRPVRASAMMADRAHYESVVEMIRGRAPGVEVMELDGGRIEIRIRGSNQSLQMNSEGGGLNQEPLVVVDGIPQSRPAGEVLLSLNPKDVANINILRDISSTAVYGTRGANGVILIRMTRRN